MVEHKIAPNQKDKISSRISGTKLDNSIILESYDYHNSYNDILYIITHELLHRWFGGLVPQNRLKEGYDKWFFEGFTEFYTYKTLLLAGLIDKETYIDYYNNRLKRYFSSPMNKLTDKEIDKLYWKGSDFQIIPYLRGNIIAQELDSRIKLYTKNKNNLEDVIAEIISLYQKNKQAEFSYNLFSESVYKVTGYDGKEFISKAAQLGEFDNIWTSLDGYKVNLQPVKVAYYGFDLLQTVINRKIIGLDKTSDGYKKGLRNNQKFKGYSDDGSKKIEVKIQTKKGIKSIRFKPLVYNYLTPCYFKE